jgi:hypothetical protein
VFEWLEGTEYADWVRESWGWPIALTVHAFGTAVVIGVTFIIALRLVGLFQTIPFTTLRKFIPVIWIAVAFQVLSGFTLWMTKPAKYVADPMFDSMITFVIIGAILNAYFQGTLRREAAAWDAAGKVTSRGARFVAATTLAWTAVLIAGRLTAYLSSLYVA